MRSKMLKQLTLLIMPMIVAVLAVHAAPPQGLAEENYAVGPGDVLNIKVWDHEDLDRSVEVSEEGAFTFPFIGKVKVSGMTTFKIEKLLEQKLADGYLVAPQVNISMAEYRNQRAFVFGEVKKPGVYMLTHRYNLLELISEAGGFTEKSGSTCTIVRPEHKANRDQPTLIEDAGKNEIITIDLEKLVSGKMVSNTPYVKPGDSIYISEAEKIYVTGEVKAPGELKWKKGITVREAVSLAGGGTARAAVNRTRVIRKVNGAEQVIKPNLGDPLLPNDIVKVPESYF
jgi:polysaccharide export outer membrane protein